MAEMKDRPKNGAKTRASGWRGYLPEDTGRFLKYAYLLIALTITIQTVFTGFSHYLSRRAFETELEGKSKANFDILEMMSRRDRALATVTLETRCAERNEIALFRVLDAEQRKKLNDVYFKTLELRSSVVVAIDKITNDHKDWAEVVDMADLKKKIRRVSSNLSDMEKLLQPVGNIARTDARYTEFSASVIQFILEESKGYLAKVQEFAKLREDIEAKIGLGESNGHFRNIVLLEERLKRIREQRTQNRKEMGLAEQPQIDDVLTRYSAWKEAQPGATFGAGLDEAPPDAGVQEARSLDTLDCERFEQFLASIGGRVLLGPDTAVANQNYFRQIMSGIGDAISTVVNPAAASFKMPLIAQTLFVTLWLGAMGALTINVLRLSKIGWWKDQDEPLWGELILSPFVGALAAFCIFLLGSTGLLLTSDVKAGQSGTTALSAFFIGLLGFVSGLLYDEAFGRVRRYGAQLFGADSAISTASPEDRSLAEVLRAAKASLAADVVLKFGIGKRLASETEFTLLVPSDEAVGRLTVQGWKQISEPTARSAFESWFRRHHAVKRVSKSDVESKTVSEIQVEAESKKYPLTVDGEDLKVNGIKVVKPDIKWEKGLIHILQEEIP